MGAEDPKLLLLTAVPGGEFYFNGSLVCGTASLLVKTQKYENIVLGITRNSLVTIQLPVNPRTILFHFSLFKRK